jgi:hypothetical protein
MPEPLTRVELDVAPCAECGKTVGDHEVNQCNDAETDDHGLYFHSLCHPDEPPWACYEPGGYVRFTCSVCELEVCEVAVAATP